MAPWGLLRTVLPLRVKSFCFLCALETPMACPPQLHAQAGRWLLQPSPPRLSWQACYATSRGGRGSRAMRDREGWSSRGRGQQQHQRQEQQQGPANEFDRQYRYPPKPPKSAFKDQLEGEVLYGVAPVLAALRARRRTPYALLMQEGLDLSARKDSRALKEVQALAAAAGAPCHLRSKHDLNMLTDSRPHQGLVLDCSPLSWQQLDEFPPAEEALNAAAATAGAADGSSSRPAYPIWLALDEVTDPQNLGAMVRSAYCLGAAGVLASSRNCAPLSAVVSKASAGAVEVLPMHSCRMMHRTLADAAMKGWAVVGAAAGAGSVPVAQWQVDRPTILVMGNEGYGLRTVVRRACTGMVEVEMQPQVNEGGAVAAVDSLNVSVATGILLHHMLNSSVRQPAASQQS